MKILHISSAKTWRGGENQISLLLRGFENRGLENVLMCPEGSPLGNRVKVRGQHTVVFFRKKAGLSLTTSRKIKSVVMDYAIDLIHVHDSHAMNYALIAKVLGGRRPILVTRRVDFDFKKSSMLKYNHRYISKIICVSKKVCQVMKDAGVSSTKLEVIRSGIDHSHNITNQDSLRESLGLDKDRVIVGFVGALVDHKDPVTFVAMANQLINELGQKQFHFIMAGLDIELGNEIKNAISGFELEQYFSILGFVPDIDRIWSGINVLVVTSKQEGLGTVILEAFSRCIPVVSTDAGGIPELVENNETGLMTAVKDYVGLADKVLEIFRNEKLSKYLVENAHALSSKFDYSVMSRKYAESYNEILR